MSTEDNAVNEVPNSTESDFDDEFAKIVNAVAAGETDPAKAASDHDPDKEEPAKEDPAKEDPAKVDSPVKEDPPKVDPPVKEDPPKVDPPVKEDPPKVDPPAKDEPPKVDPPKEEPEPEVLTAEELAELAELEKEWPDIFKAVQLREKKSQDATIKAVVKEITQILGTFREGLAPLMEKHVSSELEAHSTAILNVHKDFEALKPDVKKWILEQPSYLKKSYQEVYDEGSTQDVIDLWSRYKKEKGIAGDAPPAPRTPSTPTAPAVDPDRESKAAALEPVTSKRTTPAPDAGGVDKDDFDAAFEEATRAAQQR